MSIDASEGGAWREFVAFSGFNNREAAEAIKKFAERKFRAVRVEIREVEE